MPNTPYVLLSVLLRPSPKLPLHCLLVAVAPVVGEYPVSSLVQFPLILPPTLCSQLTPVEQAEGHEHVPNHLHLLRVLYLVQRGVELGEHGEEE